MARRLRRLLASLCAQPRKIPIASAGAPSMWLRATARFATSSECPNHMRDMWKASRFLQNPWRAVSQSSKESRLLRPMWKKNRDGRRGFGWRGVRLSGAGPFRWKRLRGSSSAPSPCISGNRMSLRQQTGSNIPEPFRKRPRLSFHGIGKRRSAPAPRWRYEITKNVFGASPTTSRSLPGRATGSATSLGTTSVGSIILRFDVEEMKDWGWKQVQHPDHVDRVVVGVKHSRETGEIWRNFPLRGKDGIYRWFLSRAVPIRDAIGNVVRWFGTNTDVTALRDAEGRQELLVNELNHRVKNTLATVQAIAAQTFRGTETDPTLREAFEARLIALSNAHSILTKSNWEGAEIGDVVQRSVEPHAGPERIQVHGPSIWLSPKAALAIALGMHELATNAAKYGALSNGTGQVAVTWSVDGPQPGTLNLQWAESGGPPVKKPTRKGFGSRLIERNLAHDLDGPSRIDYRPEGVICTITSPLESRGGANMIGVLCKGKFTENERDSEQVSRKVLIIEDEGMVATLLEDMLSDLGHEVVGIAGRMVRAAELISETSADVVILDVNLNGEQTYSLASTLASRGIPFIFATGYGSAGLKDEWRSALTLQKPFQVRDLERVMRQTLSKTA